MATLVQQIADGIEARIAVAISSSYTELKYKINVQANNFNISKKRYGVIPKGGASVEGVNRSYTIDQGFEMILTTSFINQSTNDNDQLTKVYELYSEADTIFRDIYRTKAGVPSIILNITNIEMGEPEYIDEDHIVILRTEFTVKYRNSLT